MKKLLTFFLAAFPLLAAAHGDDEHGPAPATVAGEAYHAVEAVSGNYELLLKYEYMEPGENSELRLFIANAKTNAPVDGARLRVTVSGIGRPVTTRQVDKGTYILNTVFPKKGAYNLLVNISSPLGVDLIQLSNVQAAREVPHEHEDEAQSDAPNTWFILFLGLLLGGVAMWLLMRSRSRAARQAGGIVAALLLLPATQLDTRAHGDEPHGDEAGGGGAGSPTFLMAKETQFLFGILTEPAAKGTFTGSILLSGTVIPSSTGSATIQSPQAGRIVSLNVRVGQQVSKGQVVAVIEQTIDAGTQISLSQQRNAANAELQAAKAQYDRLRSIQDIAAKRDVTEARARYETALQNKQLLDANAGGGGVAKQISLVAPISGVVGTFSFAPGAIVAPGDLILSITSLGTVYVEAQVYHEDRARLSATGAFTVESKDAGVQRRVAQARILNSGQTINPTNQAQTVVLEVSNGGGEFKIGEFVSVRAFAGGRVPGISVPAGSVTEVNGKQAVFIKDRAEQFSLAYIDAASNNGTRVLVGQGLKEGESVVTAGAYQLKMIYQNQ